MSAQGTVNCRIRPQGSAQPIDSSLAAKPTSNRTSSQIDRIDRLRKRQRVLSAKRSEIFAVA